MIKDKLTFACHNCGNKKFKIPLNPQPNDIITCPSCEATSKFIDLKEGAIEKSKDEIWKITRKIKKQLK